MRGMHQREGPQRGLGGIEGGIRIKGVGVGGGWPGERGVGVRGGAEGGG